MFDLFSSMFTDVNENQKCGFYDEGWGCTCPSIDKWYACPIESMKSENREKIREMAEWYNENPIK